MDLNQVAIFAKVVEEGSFTGAAKQLALPKGTVSRKVANLENSLGVRLLHRTTRKLRLTDVAELITCIANKAWQRLTKRIKRSRTRERYPEEPSAFPHH